MMPNNPPDQRPFYRVDPNLDRYIPNHISSEERIGNVLLSLLLIAYGTYGLWADDLVVPIRRGSGIHLHGTAAWIMIGSLMAAVLNLLSIVADHYDLRNNERHYRIIAFTTQAAGWVLCGIAVLAQMFRL